MANLSQERREKMLAFLETLKEKLSRSDDESLIALGEIERELKAKKYGLVWEEHEEEVDVKMRTHIPVFTADDSKEIHADTTTESYNFLLEGDNLHSLRLLEKTHRGKIDVIYIDPPYNTGGKDFVYDDKCVGLDDTFRHSKWISFMACRLKIAQKLLSHNGVIFISIDDHESHQLKLLCDDIFGEQNFTAAFPRLATKSGKTPVSYMISHDYVLCYTNGDEKVFVGEAFVDSSYKYEDEYVEERGKYNLKQPLDCNSISYSASLDYPIVHEGVTYYPGSDYDAYMKRKQGEHLPKDYAWRWSKELYEFGLKNGWIVFQNGRIYTKGYLNAIVERDKATGVCQIIYRDKARKISTIDFVNNLYSNDIAKKQLKACAIEATFDYPKPIELIKKLLSTYYKKNALVLDFFAGSGTTAQAVLELNQEDGGNRGFILCTNNQNNICENVTYQRIKTILTGLTAGGHTYKRPTAALLFEKELKITDLKESKILQAIEKEKEKYEGEYKKFTISFEGGCIQLYGEKETEMSGIAANLMYFRTDFVDKESEELSDELLAHIREMIQLEHGIKIDDRKYVVILSEEEMDEFEENIADYPDLKAVFINSDIFLSAKQQKMLNDVDSYVIPDYYFDFELREAGEIW